MLVPWIWVTGMEIWNRLGEFIIEHYLNDRGEVLEEFR